MDKANRREMKRMRQVLSQIVSMAEDEELEGGLLSAVRRFNAIVRHLEMLEVLPPGVFQLLSEEQGVVSFDQVGVESRMLSGYLEEVIEEEEEELPSKPDFSPVIALAPFLDHGDLKALIHSHLSGRGFAEPKVAGSAGSGAPTLKTLVGLAPHLPSKDLAVLLEACLAQEPLTDPQILVGLAPHLDSQDLGRILRQNVPNWYEARREGEPLPPPPPPAPAPATPESPRAAWQDAPPRPDTEER